MKKIKDDKWGKDNSNRKKGENHLYLQHHAGFFLHDFLWPLGQMGQVNCQDSVSGRKTHIFAGESVLWFSCVKH
jgi:hypothetical protein